MILAVGNLNMGKLLDSAIAMAKDQNRLHEFNIDNGRGSWLHDDGWGMAYIEDGTWKIHRSLKAIFDDDLIQIRKMKTNAVIIHARFGTSGKKSIENTHPFQMEHKKLGNIVFCHNGTIEEEIVHSSHFDIKGSTDSEKLFYAIVTEILGGTKKTEAIRKKLHKYQGERGSNIILSSKNYSYIGCKYSTHPRYLQMVIGSDQNQLIVCSEELPSYPNMKWKSLNSGDVVVVHNQTQRYAIDKSITQHLTL